MTVPKKRAILFVMDSLGIGGAEDAAQFGDAGANTLGHIVTAAKAGSCDIPNVRSGPLRLPHLNRLGIFDALSMASGFSNTSGDAQALWGVGVEHSNGKDTTSGHWEITGCPVKSAFHYFPEKIPAIPQPFINSVISDAQIPGVLGNRQASGTQIIEELGEEHTTSGKPIFYTSADSVIQIAAHESSFGLDGLYELCKRVRKLADGLGVGRVIARPFVGEKGSYRRTGNRRDYSMPPPADTLLDRLCAQGRHVAAVGKIWDIFAGRGISLSVKASGVDGTVDKTLSAFSALPEGGLVISNLVEFDSEFGHRRDVAGYANALEQFDRKVPELLASLSEHDILILTADHGNDPTWKGSDHTRECTPILIAGNIVPAGSIGKRPFWDIAATITEHLEISGTGVGRSFLPAAQQP